MGKDKFGKRIIYMEGLILQCIYPEERKIDIKRIVLFSREELTMTVMHLNQDNRKLFWNNYNSCLIWINPEKLCNYWWEQNFPLFCNNLSQGQAQVYKLFELKGYLVFEKADVCKYTNSFFVVKSDVFNVFALPIGLHR